jgi:hypothetical protein
VPVKARFLFSAALLGGLLAAPSAAAADPTKRECAAANETAQDLRRAGKLRDARASLAVCTAGSCPGPIREDCAQRLKEVEAATPTLVFEAKDAVGHDLSVVHVTMDGQPLLEKLDGKAIAVDPGEHTFTFEAAGLRRTEDTVVVREGEANRRLRIVLELVNAPVTKKEETSSPLMDPGTQRALGFSLVAAGGAGVAVGVIFGLLAKSTYDHALKSECMGASNCTSLGAQDGQTAHGQATVSTIAFIAGGALLAGGLVLYFTAPSSASSVAVAANVANGGGGLAVSGRW